MLEGVLDLMFWIGRFLGGVLSLLYSKMFLGTSSLDCAYEEGWEFYLWYPS
jgi:hypothetical protein